MFIFEMLRSLCNEYATVVIVRVHSHSLSLDVFVGVEQQFQYCEENLAICQVTSGDTVLPSSCVLF